MWWCSIIIFNILVDLIYYYLFMTGFIDFQFMNVLNVSLVTIINLLCYIFRNLLTHGLMISLMIFFLFLSLTIVVNLSIFVTFFHGITWPIRFIKKIIELHSYHVSFRG